MNRAPRQRPQAWWEVASGPPLHLARVSVAAYLRAPAPGDTFVYDGYALTRLEARGIGKADVEAVIKNPLRVERSRHHPERWVLARTLRGRSLRVVLAPEDRGWVVVTAWEVK